MRIIPLPLQRQAAGRGAPGSRLYGHNRGGGGQIWYLLVVDMPSRPDLFPRHLRIGPYLRTVAANAKWRTADEFPSCQEWADEVEKVLAFLDSQDQFERFLPRLSARKGERDGALAEAFVGFFFARNGFRILRWEPVVIQDRPGDLEVQWDTTAPIFVEVKGPGWESELSPSERSQGRASQPKYIDTEARWMAPAEKFRYAVTKALPKLGIERPNLIVIADDVFVSPLEWEPLKRHVSSILEHFLREPAYSAVGAVLMIRPILYEKTVQYLIGFVDNEFALGTVGSHRLSRLAWGVVPGPSVLDDIAEHRVKRCWE